VYYNTGHYHYVYITRNSGKKEICVLSCDNYTIIEQEESIEIPEDQSIILKASINKEKVQFQYRLGAIEFKNIGDVLDMNIVSDDYVRDGSKRYRPAFTGCFVAMCCQDLFQNTHHADFDWFEYKPLSI